MLPALAKMESKQNINQSAQHSDNARDIHSIALMSQIPPLAVSAATPQSSASEKNASHVHLAPQTSSNASLPLPSSSKVSSRSCTICRSRKVRCDKLSPCTTCKKAGVTCTYPSKDKPPRWARRLAASNSLAPRDSDPAAAQVMERLRDLENLVKDLSSQLEQANAAASLAASGSSGVNSPESSTQDRDQRDASPSTNTNNIQKQFGRLVLQDANRTRYVSSGFWSRVNDEIDGLKKDSHHLGAGDSDTSEDDDDDEESSPGKSLAPSTQELNRTPLERHGFLFGHNLGASTIDLREFHPLPSQIPFLFDVFCENVNCIMAVIHVPTVAKIVRHLRSSDTTSLTAASEALMFSIYYAAITSMEEDDVLKNFNFTKADLNLKYRIGLEHALAKADFLNVPDIVLVQAFSIFLSLVRRHDSPRFVWMMTGLAVRMGQALGLHRDGSHFPDLTPYDIEIRRRVWWGLCMLDIRASEDQGMEFTITRNSFDTKIPLNINDTDIGPESTQMPNEREGITDMTFALVCFETSEVVRKMMAQSVKGGTPNMEEQSQFLDEIYQAFSRRYLQYSIESGNIVYWVQVCVARLVMAKMTLFVYLPTLFSSPSEHFSDTIKNKLLIAAIEIAEYNHALNAEPACRNWRWVYQTYTHWYAIVYLLIEISRRPWSPIVERAWVALHSPWLIPAQSLDKSQRFWVPLRKLTAKAKRRRTAEIERLRNDPEAAKQLELEDQRIPEPASPGSLPAGSNVVEFFQERWRQILAAPKRLEYPQRPSQPGLEVTNSLPHFTYTPQSTTSSIPVDNLDSFNPESAFEPVYFDPFNFQSGQSLPTVPEKQSARTPNDLSEFEMEINAGLSYNASSAGPTTWSTSHGIPWLWADMDPSVDVFGNVNFDAIDVNMDLDSDMDWYNWVESAKGME